MDRVDVLTVLREKAATVVGPEELAEEARLVDLDSLALVELTMDLEDAFGLELSEDDVAAAGTVGGLVDVVLAKRA